MRVDKKAMCVSADLTSPAPFNWKQRKLLFGYFEAAIELKAKISEVTSEHAGIKLEGVFLAIARFHSTSS